MAVSAALVKELRAITDAPMMDCKKALDETAGNINDAVKYLREKGAAKAVKKASRVASEGLVVAVQRDNQIALVEVNSETDFVARNDDFIGFANDLARVTLDNNVTDVEQLKAAKINADETIEQRRQTLVAKLGENLNVRRVALITGQGTVASYVHSGRIAVIIDVINGSEELAKDLAMHIAASNPIVVSPEDVPADAVANEKDIFRAQALESGKPAEIVEKMIDGRIKKYLSEVSLLGQAFVKDPSKTVADILKADKASVKSFIRFEVGEGIEKEESDFVAEVMAQAKGA